MTFRTIVATRIAATALFAACCISAHAVFSFNIDSDAPAGTPPTLGGGVPSDAVGAAANQPGKWNRLSYTGTGPLSLVDIFGNPTSAVLRVQSGCGGMIGGGQRFEGNTGNFAKLLNDATYVGQYGGGNTWLRYTFTGLDPGPYLVYTYAVSIQGYIAGAEVSVREATGPNPRYVTGPMPGNRLEEGITHA